MLTHLEKKLFKQTEQKKKLPPSVNKNKYFVQIVKHVK